MPKTEEKRHPEIGDRILYHHHDRDVYFPGVITDVARKGAFIVYHGKFNGWSEGRADTSEGVGRGTWRYLDP